MFDKVNRLNMSITECIDNKLGNLVQPVAATAMESLRANGTLQDYKRLVDMVYQHKPEMAEQIVNNLDNDPARVRYKQHLLDHISSTRKLEQAHKNFQIVDGLTLEEQVKFLASSWKTWSMAKVKSLISSASSASRCNIFTATTSKRANMPCYMLWRIFSLNIKKRRSIGIY